jgi:ion channel
MQNHPRDNGYAFSRLLDFWTEERSLSFMLLLLLLHFFVLSPGTFLGRVFQYVGSLFLSLALLAGILALVRQRVVRRLGTLLVAGAIAFRVASIFGDAPWLLVCDTLFTLLSLAALIIIVFRIVSQEGPVSGHRVRGAVALYLLIAMLFAFLYGLTEELTHGAFNLSASWAGAARGETFYYFSIVTLTTVGFGDITPVHPFVRSLVMLEALIGQLYPAILLARLVTLELETRRSGK